MEYKSSHREIIKELSNGIHEDKDYDLAIDVKYLAHFLMVNWSRGGVIDSKNSCPNQESDSIYNKHCQIDDDNKIAIYRSPELKAYALFGSLVNKFKQMVLKVKKIAEEQNRLEFKNNIPCNPDSEFIRNILGNDFDEYLFLIELFDKLVGIRMYNDEKLLNEGKGYQIQYLFLLKK